MTSKNVSKNNVHISTRQITSKKVRGNNADFSTIEITSKEHVEITWILRPLKLRRKKSVEMTWIFRPSKLHRKNTRESRGNSLKFYLWRINVISTSNRRGFDSLGLYHFKLIHYRFLLNILLYYLIRSFSEMFFVSVFFGKTGYRGPLLLERTISLSSELEEVAIHRCSRTF